MKKKKNQPKTVVEEILSDIAGGRAFAKYKEFSSDLNEDDNLRGFDSVSEKKYSLRIRYVIIYQLTIGF